MVDRYVLVAPGIYSPVPFKRKLPKWEFAVAEVHLHTDVGSCIFRSPGDISVGVWDSDSCFQHKDFCMLKFTFWSLLVALRPSYASERLIVH